LGKKPWAASFLSPNSALSFVATFWHTLCHILVVVGDFKKTYAAVSPWDVRLTLKDHLQKKLDSEL
jgi:hypothetical protein